MQLVFGVIGGFLILVGLGVFALSMHAFMVYDPFAEDWDSFRGVGYVVISLAAATIPWTMAVIVSHLGDKKKG